MTHSGRAPIVKMSRRIPPTPVAAPWCGSMADGWLCDSMRTAIAMPPPASMTPAFSPGPTSTRSPSVGSRPRWIRDDLYEQCSDHMTPNSASSRSFGGRPRTSVTRCELVVGEAERTVQRQLPMPLLHSTKVAFASIPCVAGATPAVGRRKWQRPLSRMSSTRCWHRACEDRNRRHMGDLEARHCGLWWQSSQQRTYIQCPVLQRSPPQRRPQGGGQDDRQVRRRRRP